MTYGVAKKYLSNFPMGFRVEFVELIGSFDIKSGSDALCK